MATYLLRMLGIAEIGLNRKFSWLNVELILVFGFQYGVRIRSRVAATARLSSSASVCLAALCATSGWICLSGCSRGWR